MNTPEKVTEAPKQELQAPKKPYAKPAIVHRAPLEAVAGQCTPTPPGKELGACTTGFS